MLILDKDDLEIEFVTQFTFLIGTPCTWFLYENPPQAWDQEQTDARRDINKIPIFCLLVFMLYLKVVFIVKREICSYEQNWVCTVQAGM